jgi:hypothetical protein
MVSAATITSLTWNERVANLRRRQATVEGDRMTFELWQYLGDEWTFERERRR